jgi:cyclase
MTKFRSVLLLLMTAATAAAVFGQAAIDLPAGVDITGSYFPTRTQDSGLGTAAGMLVDYGGIPVNEGGRIYGLTWPANRMTVREQQCMGYVPPYMYIAPGNYRFWEERDPTFQRLNAIKSYAAIAEGTRTIYLDDRPHPPAYAEHTFPGFATGKFINGILAVHTTHMKRGWIRANGIAQSDQAEVNEYFIRHGDLMTYFTVTTDPVYLSEPLSKTFPLQRSINAPTGWLYACDDAEQILSRKQDADIPQFMYGQNPYLREYADRYAVPFLGALGGPETMYPEFIAKAKTPAADAEARAKTLPVAGPPHTSVAVNPNPNDGEIHTLHVRDGIYMLVGDGANIAVQIGESGAFVVDTGSGKLADKVVAAIAKLTDKPIQFIANTSFYPDHTGGNVKVHLAGADLGLFGRGAAAGEAGARSATIIAHQNVQNRMDGTPTEGWPYDTFLGGRRRKFFNGEGIDIVSQPNAVTDGNSIVYFRRADVIVTGDIFMTTQYPLIDTKNGGSLQGELDALNYILNRTVYEHDEDGGTMIIPGHGYVCNEFEVSEYKNMLIIIRDRVNDMIKKGATLAQVKAARLTADYDDRYGSNTGPWTTDMFVEAVYNSLKSN